MLRDSDMHRPTPAHEVESVVILTSILMTLFYTLKLVTSKKKTQNSMRILVYTVTQDRTTLCT